MSEYKDQAVVGQGSAYQDPAATSQVAPSAATKARSMLSSGNRDPQAFATLIASQPAARDEIITVLQSTLGNSFVRSVIDASTKAGKGPHATPANDAKEGGELSLDAEIHAGRRGVELLGVVRQTLLPGYRRSVDTLSTGPTIELATHIVSIVKGVQHAHESLQSATKHGAGSAMVSLPGGSMSDTTDAASSRFAEASALDGVLGLDLQSLIQELAIQLGPQMFRGRNVLGHTVVPNLGKDPAGYLANEAGATVELMSTILQVQQLTGADGTKCPILTDAQRLAVVGIVEPWKGRPVNLAFLRAALTDLAIWDEVASTKGAAGRTLAATADKAEAQGQITGALIDVGEFDGEEATRLLAETEGQQALNTIGGESDSRALTVFEKIAGAAPNARGGLVRQLHAMGRLKSMCGYLPWKAVENLASAVSPFDSQAAQLLEPFYVGKGGGESLHKSYMDQVDSNLKEDSTVDTVQAFGWFFLDFAHNAFTAGFLHEYSAAYDAHKSGLISDNEFSSSATKALGKAAAIIAVSALTGGVAGEFAGGLAAPLVGESAATLIGGGVGGFTAGVSGHFTGDVYDQLLNGKDGFDDVSDYAASGAIGGVMGVTTAAISQLSLQSTGMLRTSALRTADIYAQRFPRMTSLFERVRSAGANRTIQAKLKVSEVVDLIRNNMGGPGGPGALQLADGMDFRMLPPDTELNVRMSSSDLFNRPMQMSNKGEDGNTSETEPGTTEKLQSQTEEPAIKIESVDAEPLKAPVDDATMTSEPVKTPVDDATMMSSSEPVEATASVKSVPSPEAARLLAKGLPEKAIADVVTEFGQPGLQAVDRLIGEGVNPSSAVEALRAGQRGHVAKDVIDLVNSGKLRHPTSLRKFLDELASEAAIKQYGKHNELMEAKARAEAGHDVSIGGSKFDKAKPASGEADVVQYGADPEALQMKTVTSADARAVSTNLDKAVSQLKGTHGEIPPVGAKKIARALIENERNPLYTASREQLVESLRNFMQNVDVGDVIEIQIKNGRGEFKIQASELVP